MRSPQRDAVVAPSDTCSPPPEDDIGPPPPGYVPAGPPDAGRRKLRMRDRYASMPLLKIPGRSGAGKFLAEPALRDPSQPLEWRAHNRDIVRALRKECTRPCGYIDPDTALECFRLYRSWVNRPQDWFIDPDSGKLLEISHRKHSVDREEGPEIPQASGPDALAPTPVSPRTVQWVGLSGQLSDPSAVTTAEVDPRNMIGLSQLFLEHMRCANTDPQTGAVDLSFDLDFATIAMWHQSRMTPQRQAEARKVRRLLLHNFQERLAASGVLELFNDEMAVIYINELGVQINKPPPKLPVSHHYYPHGTWPEPSSKHPPFKDDSWGGLGMGAHAYKLHRRLFDHDAFLYSFARARHIPMEVAGALHRIDKGLRELMEEGCPGSQYNEVEREAMLRSLLCAAMLGLFERAANPFPLATVDAALYESLRVRLIQALFQCLHYDRSSGDKEPGLVRLPYVRSIMEMADSGKAGQHELPPPQRVEDADDARSPQTHEMPQTPTTQDAGATPVRRSLRRSNSSSSSRTRFVGSHGDDRNVSARRDDRRWVNGFASWIGMDSLPENLQSSIAGIFDGAQAGADRQAQQLACISAIMSYNSQAGHSMTPQQLAQLKRLAVKLLTMTYQPGMEKLAQ